MFIRKWSPVYAPVNDGGSDDELENDTPVEGAEGEAEVVEEEPSGRDKLRGQLESNFKKAQKEADKEEAKAAKEPAKGREGRGKALKSRAKQELEEDADQDDENLDVEPSEEPEKQQDAAGVPKAWPKEGRLIWGGLDPKAKAIITKREADMEKGVNALKAQYSELDQVLAPRREALRAQGHTEAQAVNQLFAWFDALSADPTRVKAGQPPVALLALANSFGLDLSPIFQQQQQAQPEPKKAKADAEAEDDVPEAVKTYIGQLEAKIAGLEQNVGQGFQTFQQTFAEQAQTQTNKILETWANGKPYFDEVRIDMANIIKSGMVPPREDGTADLDRAYEMALYANSEVREKVLADRRRAAIEKKRKAAEAEAAAQRKEADRARRASAGLGPSAPGVTVAGEQKPKGKKSVRESIADAIAEHGA